VQTVADLLTPETSHLNDCGIVAGKFKGFFDARSELKVTLKETYH
jgi:hypothetical protein